VVKSASQLILGGRRNAYRSHDICHDSYMVTSRGQSSASQLARRGEQVNGTRTRSRRISNSGSGMGPGQGRNCFSIELQRQYDFGLKHVS